MVLEAEPVVELRRRAAHVRRIGGDGVDDGVARRIWVELPEPARRLLELGRGEAVVGGGEGAGEREVLRELVALRLVEQQSDGFAFVAPRPVERLRREVFWAIGALGHLVDDRGAARDARRPLPLPSFAATRPLLHAFLHRQLQAARRRARVQGALVDRSMDRRSMDR